MEDGEKEDTAKEEEQAEALWADVTKKKKRRCGQKVEKPEAFMANFFKGLEIYQTKLLVSTPASALLGCGHWPGQTSENWPLTLFHHLVSHSASSSCSFLLSSSPLICLCLLCWRERKRG